MRIKISINLPWPIATISILVITVLLTGIATLNYYSYKRLNQFETLNKDALLSLSSQNTRTGETLFQTQEEVRTKQTSGSSITKTISQAPENQAFNADLTLSAKDITPYLTTAVQIVCVNEKGAASTGSGSLWNFNEVPYAVVTNLHVVKDQKSCIAYVTGNGNESLGFFTLEGLVYTFNTLTDTAVVTLGNQLVSTDIPKEAGNFSLTKLRRCPSSTPIGTPVVLIGFPMFAKRDAKLSIPGLGTMDEVYRSVTNGIISGYDTSKTAPRGSLQHQNFFISAKIDAGNSGGIALAKDTKGICVLGIPTWLSVGTYENQGLIQNIANVIP